MKYQTQKILDFSEENTSLICLLRGAILLKDGKEKVLQLKLRNDSKNIVEEVTLQITCKNEEGQLLGTQLFTYSNLFILSGQEFGSNVPIFLKYADTEQVSIEIEESFNEIEINNNKKNKNEFLFDSNENFKIISIGNNIIVGIISLWVIIYPTIGKLFFSSHHLLACSYLFFPYSTIQVALSRKKAYKAALAFNILFFLGIPILIVSSRAGSDYPGNIGIYTICWISLVLVTIWTKRWSDLLISILAFVIFIIQQIRVYQQYGRYFNLFVADMLAPSYEIIYFIPFGIISIMGLYHLIKKKFKIL